MLDTWDAVSGEAAARRASTGAAALSRGEALDALRLQLTKNLLALGIEYLGRPEMASAFFNTSLLYNRQANGAENDELPEPPTVSV